MLSETERRILALYQAQVVIDSETTLAGNAGGMSIIDSTLIGAGANSFLACAVIINPGTFSSFDVKPVAGFNNVTGEVTVSAVFKGGQVAISTRYMIVSIGGGGGAPPPPVAPSIGLWMFGVCDPGMTASATTLVCTNLAGFPDEIFNNEFWVQVIHNASVPGAAPEGEWRKISNYVGATGTFTVDAFSANVEENDLLAIVHESIVGIEILGTGTLTTDSANVPADTSRTEGDNYFNGCLLMTTEGAGRFQPRLIADYTGATGVFTLDAEHPFIAAPGLSDYVIISFQGALVPAADGANNLTLMDVVGNKADTPIYSAAFNVSSVIRYLKGLMGAKIRAYGAAEAGSDADTLVDAALTQGDDYWKGLTLLMLTGANAGLARPIVAFTDVGDIVEVRPAFPAAIVATDTYVILSDYHEVVPGVDAAENYSPRDILGNKADTAITVADDVSSIIRYLKGIIAAAVQIYQEQIPDTDFALAAIDTVLTNPPPAADAENSIVDIDQVADSTFVLRSLWVNVTSFGTGATMTFQLWVLLNGVVTSVDSVIVNALGIQNLMDIFGLPEVHADGIWITAIVDVGNTGACSGTYNFAEAKK